jgi:hypothetical protein
MIILSLKKISSCWELDRKGICEVKKEEWMQRLIVLEQHWIDSGSETNKTIEVMQLFYGSA